MGAEFTGETVNEQRREVALPLKTVATLMLGKAGVDAGRLADPLVHDAVAELTTRHGSTRSPRDADPSAPTRCRGY